MALSELRYDPALACKITISCIVLHNVATTLGLPHPDSDTDNDESDSSDSELDDGNNEQDGVQSGRLARDRIVSRYFQQ
ncbi:hypothetical protein C0Q70_21644 [Pomacea canaliculata]|uniref:Nuclease HARBI1 n=1 Tax=Pomacea canaliculata TaxID=400727 RepID=A0A2T7ND52_POMCA|nr:hypothetical protein C0Q70_21644 [Pomacea canaliculata]